MNERGGWNVLIDRLHIQKSSLAIRPATVPVLRPGLRLFMRLAGCFVFSTAAMVLGGPAIQNNSIWACNGLLLSYLLLAPRRRWLAYIAAGLAAQVFGGFLTGGETWPINIALATLNIAEVVLAAFLLRTGSKTHLPRFTDRFYLIRFVAFAIVGAPAIVGVVFAVIAHQWVHEPLFIDFRNWFTTDSLGYAVATPAFVAIFRTRFRGTLQSRWSWLYLLLMVPVTYFALQQAQLAALSIIGSILIFILLRLGIGWASMATLLVALVANLYIAHAPQKVDPSVEGVNSIIRLQVSLASILFMLYSVSVVMERHRAAEKKLQAAYRTMEAMAVMDSLTGLANRRRLDDFLETEWRRARRDRKPLSMVLIDVDLFKLYNDSYGHLRGDTCLKIIAEAVGEAAARRVDLVARFGGEEFAVILPGTAAEGAATVANGIFASLRSRNLPHSASPFGIVTVSAGCATVIPEAGQTASDLIELADRALYTAKALGRNQVCAAPGSAAPVSGRVT
jgi:diguanylate cyclase (GGDEF)-like protein